MPVALHDLYAPISEFFLTKFGTGTGAQIAFRFDKFGSLLADADFIDESHPERGLQLALAVEKFSDLVNRVPMDTGDGANIILSQAAIDDIYFYQLLAPAIPAVPTGADDTTRTSLIDSFNAIKAEAMREWARLTLQSSSGLMLNFKPSVAQPESWYDPGASQAWTHQTFHIEASDSAPSPPLFRLRPSDEVLMSEFKLEPGVEPNRNQLLEEITAPAVVLPPDEQLVAVPPEDQLVDPGVTRNRGQLLEEITAPAVVLPADEQLFEAVAAPPVARLAEAAREVSPRLTMRAMANVPAARRFRTDDGTESGGDLHGSILSQLRGMRFDERVMVNQRVQEVAPQAPVTTSSVSISFDYCLVNIQRPWWMDAFINSGTWYVPGVPGGQVSSGDRPGTIAWLPVGFVAVRNLTISAQWSAEDAANLGMATDFGPFQVEASGAQTLAHPGVQVVGWLLQRLPALPPASAAVTGPANVPPPAPRTYTVVAGDTLGKIAKTFYGEANRYPDIQHANGIADPNLIYVGQVLTIP